MIPVRCVLAEWQLVRARLLRSRLGLWLLLLAAGGAWLALRTAGAAGLTPLALRVGMLGAILCVAFGAGADADRAALALTLTHPTTPAAVAVGRWLAAVSAATIATLAAVIAVAGLTDATGWAVVRAALAGVGAAGAAAACALPSVWLGGNALAGVLFVYIAGLSAIPPAALRDWVALAPLRDIGIAVLELAPSLWRYRALATGDVGAWLHAVGWTVIGVVLASVVVRKRAW